MTIRKPAATCLAAITLSLGLAGCGGGEQSVADACTTAEKEVTAAMGDLGSIDATDTGAAAEKIGTMTETLKSAGAKIDNTEVKDALADMTAQFEKLEQAFVDLKAAAKDSEKLQEVSTNLSEISTAVQDKGEKLDELCKS